MVYATGILDTTSRGNISSEVALTGESVITLDVSFETGSHNNSRCELQHSPDDGVTWFSGNESTNGTGTITVTMATSMVRVFVLTGEGVASSAKYFITAR